MLPFNQHHFPSLQFDIYSYLSISPAWFCNSTIEYLHWWNFRLTRGTRGKVQQVHNVWLGSHIYKYMFGIITTFHQENWPPRRHIYDVDKSQSIRDVISFFFFTHNNVMSLTYLSKKFSIIIQNLLIQRPRDH